MTASTDTAAPSPQRRLTIPDLITVGLFFVINMVLGVLIAFVGVTPWTFVLIAPLQALLLGIPMMLFFAKIRKPGMLLSFVVLTGLANLLLGLGPYNLIAGVLLGLLGELLLRAGNYRSARNSILAYALNAVASTATYIPMFFATSSYLTSTDTERKYGADFARGLAAIGHQTWLLGALVVVTFGCGLLGGILGRRIFDKHFRRAGIV